ncbi:MAG: hypothetical protein JO266_21315 [Acidobacteria bacterium]|nr:hypothetical protein [Acidobacteriota bacterium]
MKKETLFPLLAVLLLATGLASAQRKQGPVKANIPFDFVAGNTSMPAGEYRISQLSNVGVLSIKGESGEIALVGSNSVQANAMSPGTRLIFHRYGDQYFLYQVWTEGDDRGREVPKLRWEKELTSNSRYPSVAVLAHK